ncbi:MAG: PLD nuclease N-terminal domain-containing protein [Microcella sp.]|nr:PLD nuclease N-terminal domain-containing protein [Microcella sp.]
MTRLLIVLIVVAVAFTIYTLVDVLLTDRSRVRAFPKPLWAAVVVLLPVIGGLLWLIVGKARRIPGSSSRPIAPDDDPTFLRTLNRDDIAKRAEQEERLRRLEQELADLDDDTPADPER